MRVGASGFGAGHREIDGRPNAVQVVVGAAVPAPPAGAAGGGALVAAGPASPGGQVGVTPGQPTGQVGVAPGQPVVLIEANVDDATGEVLAHAVAALLDAGAHDAWVTPVVMKKGRPAHVVSALTDPALVAQVAATLSAETGSLGVRGSALERWPRTRTPGTVTVEHDDAARVARATRVPLREVISVAEAEARRQRRPPDDRPGDGPDDDLPA